MSSDVSSDILGVALFVLGACLTTWHMKRRFDRTNALGVQRFPGFWSMMIARAQDVLLASVSMLLLGSGLISLAFNHLDSWGWIVALPVLGFVLFILIGT